MQLKETRCTHCKNCYKGTIRFSDAYSMLMAGNGALSSRILVFEWPLVMFGPNYTIDRSVGKTHCQPGGCLAAAVGGVVHMLSCHSYFYVKTEHLSAPIKDKK